MGKTLFSEITADCHEKIEIHTKQARAELSQAQPELELQLSPNYNDHDLAQSRNFI